MSRFSVLGAALLAVAALALCVGGFAGGGNANGDQIPDPGAQVSVTIQDTRGNLLAGVPVTVVDTEGKPVNRQQTDLNGSRHVSLPGHAGTYVVIASRPVVDGQEYVENRDSDQGAPAPAGARCPHLIRCVTVTVDARGTLHGPSQNPAQVDFLFTPPADVPVEQPRTEPANRTVRVRFWDVTDGNRAPLSHSQVRIVWVDAGQGRTRPVDGPDLTLIGAGAIDIEFIAPAGYQAEGRTRVSVPADLAATVDFSARRVVTGDQANHGPHEEGSAPTGATTTTSPEGASGPPSPVPPPAESQSAPPPPAESEMPEPTSEDADELDPPVVSPFPRPTGTVPVGSDR